MANTTKDTAGSSEENFGPLFHLLWKGSRDIKTLQRENSNEMAITERILGTLAYNIYPIYLQHPPTFYIYVYMIPRFIDLPGVDLASLKLGKSLSPEVRAACMYVVSKDYNCRYCAAHTCSMGTIISGARVQEGVTPEKLNPGLTDTAVNLVQKANRYPSDVTQEDVDKTLAKYGSRANLIQIATFGGIMGWLNYFQKIMGTEEEQFFFGEGKKAHEGFFSTVGSVFKILNAVRHLKKNEKSYFDKYPLKDKLFSEQKAVIESWFGFVPSWFENMHIPGREAITMFIEEVLLKDTSQGTFSSLLRIKLWFVFTKLTGNQYLNHCAAMLANKQHAVNLLAECNFSEAEKVLEIIVEKSSSMPHDVLDEDTSTKFAAVCNESRSEMVEIISTIGFFVTMHRISNVTSFLGLRRAGAVVETPEEHKVKVETLVKAL